MSHGRQVVVFFIAVFAWTWGITAIMVLFPDWVESTFGEMSVGIGAAAAVLMMVFGRLGQPAPPEARAHWQGALSS